MIPLKTKFIILLSVLLIVVGCATQPTGFDLVCQYFNDLEKENGLKGMSEDERFVFIDSRIKKNLLADDYAYITWEALILSPEERYSLFSEAAKEVTKREWSCQSMQRLSASVVYKAIDPANKPPKGVVRMRGAKWD